MLLLGFAVVLSLIAAVSIVTSLVSYRVQAETRALVEQAERSAYLIGHIGQELERVRAQTLETLTEPVDSIGPLVDVIDHVNHGLDVDIAALPGVLTPQEAVQWRDLAPRVQELRETLALALSEVRAGNATQAESTLDLVMNANETLSADLESFSDLGDRMVNQALAQAERQMVWYRSLELAAFFVLFASTSVIAFSVARLVRQQRVRVAQHIATIEHINQDLEAFAGRVAHDLKNALSPLHLLGPTLKRAADDPDRVRALAQRVESSTKKTVDLLEGLLAFARSGAPADAPAKASVKAEVAAVLDELEDVRERVGASVDVKVDEGLVAGCAPALLHVVLLNLLSNALKFLEGRDTRSVVVDAHRAGDDVEIAVADTGPGVPQDARARIFEPFFRVAGVRATGSGIGLATVRRVVDAYGGSVACESVEGRGATFRVHLPAAHEAAAHA